MKTVLTPIPIAALLLLSAPLAWAQDAGQAAVGRSVSVTTSVSVTETLTNNVAPGSADPKSEQITEISPGIHININGARLKTYFDYSLSHVSYAQGTSASRNQNSLNTFGSFEAVDNWAFIDFSGSISQQTISAFGTQSINNTDINANRTEMANYRLSPYIKGHFGSVANYEARISRSVSSSDAATASNSANTDSGLKISSASAYRNLGWNADASRQTLDYSAGRTTEADNFSLGLTYELTPQVKLSANAGRESSNYSSLEKQNYNTSSVGLNWTPSTTTTVSATSGKRSFGNTHNLSFEHRSARTVWRFTDSKDVYAGPNQTGVGTVGNVYDLLYSQTAGSGLTPAARAALVNSFMAARGFSPTATVLGNFLTSAASVQRRQDLSFAILGIRDTITFLLTRTESNRLDTFSSAFDDLSNGATVVQNGFSVNYSHRLTPDYSLGVLLSQQNSSGSTTAQENKLKSINVNLTGTVGRRTGASLGLRRVVSDSLTTPYTETAVTGNLNVQF